MIKKIFLLVFVFGLLLISDILLFDYLGLDFINTRNLFWIHFFLLLLTLLFFLMYNFFQKRKTKSPFTYLSLSLSIKASNFVSFLKSRSKENSEVRSDKYFIKGFSESELSWISFSTSSNSRV